jgi:DNA polymerase-3 subunit beta
MSKERKPYRVAKTKTDAGVYRVLRRDDEKTVGTVCKDGPTWKARTFANGQTSPRLAAGFRTRRVAAEHVWETYHAETVPADPETVQARAIRDSRKPAGYNVPLESALGWIRTHAVSYRVGPVTTLELDGLPVATLKPGKTDFVLEITRHGEDSGLGPRAVSVNGKALYQELRAHDKVAEKRTTIAVLSHVRISGDGSGRLTLESTDLELSLVSTLPVTETGTGSDWSYCVPASDLQRFLKTMQSGNVRLSVKPRADVLILTADDGAALELRGLPAEDFPVLPDVNPDNVQASVDCRLDDIRQALDVVTRYVSTEESRFQISGALFETSKTAGALTMAGTDGHRLTVVEIPATSNGAALDCLVPRCALDLLDTAVLWGPRSWQAHSDTLTVRRTGHHIEIRTGNRSILCRILEGTFPNYERVITRDNPASVVLSVRDLDKQLERACLLIGKRSRAFCLTADPTGTRLEASHPDRGTFRHTFAATPEGADSIRIGLNPDYMRAVLATMKKTATVRLTFGEDSENCQTVLSPSLDGTPFLRRDDVVMPIRL